MSATQGTYRDWVGTRYMPVIEAHLPHALVAVLQPDARVLEIGCYDGIVSCFVAAQLPMATVQGVDINPAAVDAARLRASAGSLRNVRFEASDALTVQGVYDAVITIRVLTCFPEAAEWHALIAAVERLLRPGGCWYAVDYAFDDANPAYARRYAEGERAGWRRGNFRVEATRGQTLFVAHHHTKEEIACLRERFGNATIRTFESRSMNGNPATMFELLGYREEAAQ